MTVEAFHAELEKIARAGAASTLELRPRPWELGIHAKREGQGQRGVAYPAGVASAALAGTAAGTGAGAIAGGPPLRLLQKKVREEAIEKGIKDIAATRRAYGEAQKVGLTRAFKGAPEAYEKAKKSIRKKDWKGAREHLRNLPKDPERMERAVEKGLRKFVGDPKIKEIALRRAKGAGKAALTGAATLGGAKLVHNVLSYESAKALANKPPKTRRMRKRRS